MEAVTCCTAELCCWAPEASVCELSAITREPSANWLAALADLLDRSADRLDDQVHVVPQLAVGARILLLHGLREVLAGHALEDLADVLDGSRETFQRGVHGFEDFAVLALVAGGVRASVELARDGRLGQRSHVAQQTQETVAEKIHFLVGQRLLSRQFGQDRGEVAFRVGRKDVENRQNVVDVDLHALIGALSQGAVGALEPFGGNEDVDGALLVLVGHVAGLGDHAVQSVDALVEVVLDLVEVAVVAVGDLRRDVALGNAVHVLGGHLQRTDHGVQRGVDALDDRAELQAYQFGVSAGLELSFDSRRAEPLGLADDGTKHLGDAVRKEHAE